MQKLEEIKKQKPNIDILNLFCLVVNLHESIKFCVRNIFLIEISFNDNGNAKDFFLIWKKD